MNANLSEKDRLVLLLALENQKDAYLDMIRAGEDNGLGQECIEILDGISNKLHSANDKDVLMRDGTQATVGYSLKEAQSMYIALHTFKTQSDMLSIASAGEELPDALKAEMSTLGDLEEYRIIAGRYLNQLADSFHEAGIKISDFYTVHNNVDSFYEATGRRPKGGDRNLPCPCGSSKKYKHCCGR